MRYVLTLLLALLALLSFQTVALPAPWDTVTLRWTTVGDDSLLGQASSYDIRVATFAITAANFTTATRIFGSKIPQSPGTIDSVQVTGLQPLTTYWFAVKTADEVPNWSLISNVVSRTTAAAPDTIAPAAIRDLTAH